MAPDLNELLRRLWEAADQLRANSGLRASEYSTRCPRTHLSALRRPPVRRCA